MSDIRVFKESDLDEFWEKYHLGIDFNGNIMCYTMFNGTIPFIVDAQEFDKACRDFARKYYNETNLIDE